MRSTLPQWALQEAGAPAEVWLDIQSAADRDDLTYDVIWVNKTATRLPEVCPNDAHFEINLPETCQLDAQGVASAWG